MIHHVLIGTAELYALQVWPVQQLPVPELLRTVDGPALAAHHARHAAFSHANGQLLDFTLNVFLLRHAGRTVLIDTGEAVTKNGAVLDWGLHALGVHRHEIDLVFLTHRDDDHVGGVLTHTGQPRFPRARYVMARREFEDFQRDTRRADQFQRSLAPLLNAGQLDLLDDGAEVAPSLSAVPTPGHRPGATSLRVQVGGHAALILADTLHVPAQITHPAWSSVWDSDPEEAARSRARVVEQASTEQTILAVPHIPGAFGRVNTDGTTGRREWAPCGSVLESG